MTDADDDLRRETIRRVRGEGVAVAFEACMAVASDPRAPAPARATAAVALMRAGGLFSASETADPAGKEPHEMTPAELAAATKRLRRQLLTPEPSDEAIGSVFD